MQEALWTAEAWEDHLDVALSSRQLTPDLLALEKGRPGTGELISLRA